ncbi:flagellar protein FlaG [Pollutimonas sp. M17]|uniref:flagellar protein FlaG n=1 Tax=Pollutimonas sp. M17 TaxID=2962065 RepID=UPI0021F43FA3|nr:flagellar protein FlaG [Pollutimonas sp. M17]UYO94986.1 flagellar protein FlaG [Pollutimonas sp. M17]
MVNPIASGVTAMPFGTPSTDFERPVSLPEPAVTVTKSSETLNSGSSTSTQREAEELPEGMDPLAKALDMVNNNMKAWSTGMRFDVDPEAQRVVVSIIDTETGDVLRTVPTDAVIRVAKMIVQLQGRSVDTKV